MFVVVCLVFVGAFDSISGVCTFILVSGLGFWVSEFVFQLPGLGILGLDLYLWDLLSKKSILRDGLHLYFGCVVLWLQHEIIPWVFGIVSTTGKHVSVKSSIRAGSWLMFHDIIGRDIPWRPWSRNIKDAVQYTYMNRHRSQEQTRNTHIYMYIFTRIYIHALAYGCVHFLHSWTIDQLSQEWSLCRVLCSRWAFMASSHIPLRILVTPIHAALDG